MFPFSFGKKLDLGKEFSLGEIPLFSSLSGSEIKFIEKKVRLVEYKKNELVYKQGNDPDAFYVICSGRFRVFIQEGAETERTVTYLYRGDYFGEISILTEKPHSVTVEAINDSLVLRLEKNDFEELLKNIPSLAIHLSRSLGLRLRDEAKEQTGEAKIVSVYSVKEGVGKTTFLLNLSLSLQQELKKPILYVDMNPACPAFAHWVGSGTPSVLHLDETDVSRDSEIEKYLYKTPSGVTLLNLQNGTGANFYEKKLVTLLSYLISRHTFVLIDLPLEIGEIVFKVLTQSDVIYVLTDGEIEDLYKCRSLIAEMKKSFTFDDEEIKLILAEAVRKEHGTLEDIHKTAEHKVFAVLPYAMELEAGNRKPFETFPEDARHRLPLYWRTIRYMARELSGKLVGLALGSGAAHGFAHVGVLKVLEEAHIPVDVVAGSSMGALVGALWASGYTIQELEKIALSLDKKASFFNIIGVTDFSMAHKGFLKGRAVSRFLRTLLGQKTFRDLEIPMKIVATNLFTAEEVLFEDGDVVEALRASISIPGIFRPHAVGGKVLIDGGVINPVPVKVLSRMGVKKIIAVNVLSGPSDILKRREVLKQKALEMERRASEGGLFKRWLFALRKKMRKRYSANIFNVLVNSIQYMEYLIASMTTTEADVVIHPITYDAHWIEFYKAANFIKVGEEKTREQLLEIKKLVEQ